jgi:GPH family glycoside/pentoside/hexuronide:cation symporter
VALIVQSFTADLVAWAGGGNDQAGWRTIMVLYGGIAAVLFVLCFLTTKERVEPPAKQQSNIREDVKALMQNAPWMVMFFMGMLVIAGFALRGGTLLYYFKYYVEDGEQIFSKFMFSGGIAALVGVTLMPLGTKYIGKRRLYVLCMAGAGLLTLPYYFLPPDAIVAIYGLNIAVSFLLGPTAPLIFVMFTDVADYGEWKTGRRTTGLVMAAAMLSLKFGGAIGGFANGQILEAGGFVANQVQTADATTAILLLMGVIPALTTIGAAGVAMLYKLDDKTMKTIETDLLARRSAEQQPAAS